MQLTSTGLLLALAIASGSAREPALQVQAPRPASPARPNIVWISNEDMSPHLGVYGDAVARTPTLDRLATQSIRFTQAFTTAPTAPELPHTRA